MDITTLTSRCNTRQGIRAALCAIPYTPAIALTVMQLIALMILDGSCCRFSVILPENSATDSVSFSINNGVPDIPPKDFNKIAKLRVLQADFDPLIQNRYVIHAGP